ncbi:monooxygenase FAD-binding [Catenulispora acidiphila DSM 44928]|uniref:Monooxygenase FAD-binding n=1 Tax=Catenulispora acidiphila (strain DSM 44928 / JCM 14897 / NBRC 102108 / NRRL B-24433 / ID139908) TaxID=479433 RepID=C7PXP2_CATAD|nr:FAD-dependent monooxygenase [Catenulispora acidiphila]ACU71495.1 monooxygenase FAD-binding [Catenulispora acidiphila DSM 44928]
MYDVIIVGARCAGAATALLLARQGVRVLLADRTTFPSDTVSTHLLHPAGVARLREWNLLEPLLATGCPPLDAISYHAAEDLVLRGAPYAYEDVTISVAPRRTVLDALLVEAAVAAGAELREGASLRNVLWEDGRVVGAEFGSGADSSGGSGVFTERASLVIGADGRHSTVAREVGAKLVRDAGTFGCQFYGYWSGLPDEGTQIFIGGGQAVLAYPTHDRHHLVLVGWPHARFAEVKQDIDRHFLAAVATSAPAVREHLTDDARSERITGSGDLANYVRESSGPGWVLVGDAAMAKDAVTAQGIGDAFSQAQSLAERLPAALAAGPRAVDASTAAHVADRDRDGATAFETTVAFAMGGNSSELLPVLRAIADRPDLVSMFYGIYAGRVTMDEFAAAVG